MKTSHKPASLFTPGTGLKGLRGLLCAALLAPMAAMAQPGSLDPNFDDDGRATFNFVDPGVQNIVSTANAIALQGDGKIVTAGVAAFPELDASAAFIARQNLDGSLDTGFTSSEGKIFFSFGAGTDMHANTVGIQADGKILAGGIRTGTPSEGAAMFRLNTDGSVDGSFGGGFAFLGLSLHTIVDPSFGIVDMALQDDGKIVTVLRSFSGAPETGLFVVARFLQDGPLDTSFGIDGVATVDLEPGGLEYSESLALQDDGKIVVGGTAGDNLAIIRLNADGSQDASFANNGYFILFDNGIQKAADLTLQSDGKILLAGFEDDGLGQNTSIVLRLTDDGILDTSFAAGTGVFADPLFFNGNTLSAIALDADGRILISGHTIGANDTESEFTLVRLNQDGSQDSEFGDSEFGFNGGVTTSFDPETSSQANDLAVQADGRIVLAGFSGDDFAFARYFEKALPPAGPLTYYLHGNDVPGTLDGFTMDTNPPSPPQPLQLNLANAPTWYSQPALSGSFAAGNFVLSFPCALGLSVATTYTLHRTAPDGGSPELVSSLTQPLQICTGMQAINLPVAASENFLNERLRLRISTLLGLNITLNLSEDVKLVTTEFEEGGISD